MHSVQFVLIGSLSALVRMGSEWCLVPMPGSGGPAARPPHTCSLCNTYTSASGFKLAAGVQDHHRSESDKKMASPVSFKKIEFVLIVFLSAVCE